MWPTFPGLGGLSVRTDLNVGITSFRCPTVYVYLKEIVELDVFLRHPTMKHSNLLCAVVSSF